MSAGADYNSFTAIGTVISSPELRIGKNSSRQYASFLLRVRNTQTYKKDLMVVCFCVDGMARVVARFLRVGSRVFVEGVIWTTELGRPQPADKFGASMWLRQVRLIEHDRPSAEIQLRGTAPREAEVDEISDPGDLSVE